MKKWVIFFSALCLVGCGGDDGLSGDRTGGECETKILNGDYTIHTTRDAERLERAGGCSYTIAGDLIITEVDAAVLEGLEDLSAVGGDLRIYDNEELQSFEGLVDLTTVGGHVYIHDNEALQSFEGMFLQTVSGHVKVYNNDKLIDIDGLSKLNTVGGDLQISNNNKLTNVDGLFNLVAVGGSFRL